MSRIAAVIAIFIAGSAWAQKAPEKVDGAALQQLEAAAGSSMGPVADGSAKQNDNGTETVGVEKNILLDVKNVPARRTCVPDATDPGDGRSHHMSRTCDSEPAHTVKVYGDREHVHITDRSKFASSEGKSGAGWGALIGGGIGLLGFLTCLIPGVGLAGIAIGLITTAVGAGAGAGIGYAVAKGNAKKKPEDFTKDDEKWSETVYP